MRQDSVKPVNYAFFDQLVCHITQTNGSKLRHSFWVGHLGYQGDKSVIYTTWNGLAPQDLEHNIAHILFNNVPIPLKEIGMETVQA